MQRKPIMNQHVSIWFNMYHIKSCQFNRSHIQLPIYPGPRGRSCDPSLQPGCVNKSGHLDVESQAFPRNKKNKKKKKSRGILHFWTGFLSFVATSTIAESTTVKWPMPELEACLQLDNLQARAAFLHLSWSEKVYTIQIYTNNIISWSVFFWNMLKYVEIL